MNKKQARARAAVLLAVIVIAVLLLLRRCGGKPSEVPLPVPTPVPSAASAAPVSPVPSPVRAPTRVPVAKPSPHPSPVGPRPRVEVFPELIPKDIKIVRVYYVNMIAAPGDTIEFDINGSGFTKEFQRMIKVQAGRDDVAVKDLTLVTPNQIHGRLVSDASAKTDFSFPTVSIGDKVVFQANEPFAIIRSGEVLNLLFTEMGESGRTGRFRIFTNLTQEMFQQFFVTPSTPTIQIANLTPSLPFLVDGTLLIGPAVTGEYGVKIDLAGKVIWQRDGIIRIVRPNLGQTGLVQRLQPEDGYHRPGDLAKFLVQGSGFQFEDTAALTADVPGIEGESSTFLYLAPGRLGLDLKIPANAPEGPQGIVIKNGDAVLLNVAKAFVIVPHNWLRTLRSEPPLKAGTASQLVLSGRALDPSFVESLTTEVDEPGLVVGPFIFVDDRRAVADVEAKPGVKPGDYQVRIRAGKRPVVPHTGDIVNVGP